MATRFEVNPPKVLQGDTLSHKVLSDSISRLKQRVADITAVCDGIHLTDSVLGVPRISPITTGSLIKRNDQNLQITASLRTRDRNLTSLTQSVCDALLLGLDGILVLKGDTPPAGPQDSGLVPSQVLSHFNGLGFGRKIDLFLSLPRYPNFDRIHKKIEAEPAGFVTQVIHSIDEVQRITDRLRPQGFKVVPVVLVPSEKNTKSAEFLRLDWSGYADSAAEFAREVRKTAGDILLSSPNDFEAARRLLEQIS